MRTRTKVIIGVFLVILIALCVMCAVFLGKEIRGAKSSYEHTKSYAEVFGQKQVYTEFMKLFSHFIVFIPLGVVVFFSCVILIEIIFKKNLFYKFQFTYEEYKEKQYLAKQKKIEKKKQKLKDKYDKL